MAPAKFCAPAGAADRINARTANAVSSPERDPGRRSGAFMWLFSSSLCALGSALGLVDNRAHVSERGTEAVLLHGSVEAHGRKSITRGYTKVHVLLEPKHLKNNLMNENARDLQSFA